MSGWPHRGQNIFRSRVLPFTRNEAAQAGHRRNAHGACQDRGVSGRAACFGDNAGDVKFLQQRGLGGQDLRGHQDHWLGSHQALRRLLQRQMGDDALLSGWWDGVTPANAVDVVHDDARMGAWAERSVTIAIRIDDRDDDMVLAMDAAAGNASKQ